VVERFNVYLADDDGVKCEVVPSSHYDDLLAHLALAREWIESAGHTLSCEHNAWEVSVPCTCGRDALLKVLEVPK